MCVCAAWDVLDPGGERLRSLGAVRRGTCSILGESAGRLEYAGVGGKERTAWSDAFLAASSLSHIEDREERRDLHLEEFFHHLEGELRIKLLVELLNLMKVLRLAASR